MTKEAFERAKKLDENIYYIKKLLNTLNDPDLHVYSSITGKDFRMCTLDVLTHDIIIEDMKETLNQRIDEMKRELEDL